MTESRKCLSALAVIALATILSYFRVINSYFNALDDALYVVLNNLITNPTIDSLKELWSPERALAGTFVEYFPLRDSIYWLTSRLFGVAPAAFHAVNILVHLLCSWMVLRFLRTWGLSWAAATFGGLIFAAHPVHTESVSWISALKDPLYSLFVIATLDCHLRWLHSRRAGWLALSLVALIASLLTKSIGVVVFPVIFLFGVWEKRGLVRSAVVALPYAVLCGSFLTLFLQIGAANDVIRPIGSYWVQFSVIVWNLLWYVGLTVFPYDLVIWHAVMPFFGLEWRHAIIAVFCLTGLVLFSYALMKQREAALWVCFFVLFLVPVLGFIAIPVFYADRYLYLSILAVSVLLGRRWDESPRWRPFLVAVLLLFSLRTVARNEQWRSNIEIWEEATSQQGADSAPALFASLGATHMNEGNAGRAAFAYERALQLDSRTLDNAPGPSQRVREQWRARTWSDLAAARRIVGDLPGALVAARESTKRDPGSAAFWLVQANLEASLGQQEAALASLTRLLRLEPLSPAGHYTRALSRFDLGQIDLGRADLERALHLDPAFVCPLGVRYVKGAAPAVVKQMRDIIDDGCEERAPPPDPDGD